MNKTKNIDQEIEIEVMREHLFSPEELKVLSYLRNFNRRASQAWAEDSYPEFWRAS